MKNNTRKITTPQSLNAYIKGICIVMRRSGQAGALLYVSELTWMLFLRKELIAIIESQAEEIQKAIRLIKGKER